MKKLLVFVVIILFFLSSCLHDNYELQQNPNSEEVKAYRDEFSGSQPNVYTYEEVVDVVEQYMLSHHVNFDYFKQVTSEKYTIETHINYNVYNSELQFMLSYNHMSPYANHNGSNLNKVLNQTYSYTLNKEGEISDFQSSFENKFEKIEKDSDDYLNLISHIESFFLEGVDEATNIENINGEYVFTYGIITTFIAEDASYIKKIGTHPVTNNKLYTEIRFYN